MKKIVKISLMLGIVLLAMNVYAVAIKFSLQKKIRQEKMVTFGLNDKNKIELSIYDENEKLINTQSIFSNGKMIWTYDLNNFPEGVYYIVAESPAKITKYEVLVVSESATVMSDPLMELSKPVL